MESSFDLPHFWSQGDGFTHFTAIILLIMSILSWSVIFIRLSMLYRLRRLPTGLAAFWHNPDEQTRLAALAQYDAENLLLPMAQSLQQDTTTTVLERQLSQSVRQANHRLEQGLTLLATVASSAPFVGLLGTVWGIYRTLTSVSSQGQLDIANVIGPVGEALVMTAAGLAVALPALFAYNFFSRSNQNYVAEIEAFAHDILNARAD